MQVLPLRADSFKLTWIFAPPLCYLTNTVRRAALDVSASYLYTCSWYRKFRFSSTITKNVDSTFQDNHVAQSFKT